MQQPREEAYIFQKLITFAGLHTFVQRDNQINKTLYETKSTVPLQPAPCTDSAR